MSLRENFQSLMSGGLFGYVVRGRRECMMGLSHLTFDNVQSRREQVGRKMCVGIDAGDRVTRSGGVGRFKPRYVRFPLCT